MSDSAIADQIVKKMRNQTFKGILATAVVFSIIAVLKLIEETDPMGILNYVAILFSLSLAWVAQYFLFKKIVIRELSK